MNEAEEKRQRIREGITKEQFAYWCSGLKSEHAGLWADLDEVSARIMRYLDRQDVRGTMRELPDKNKNHTWYQDDCGEAGKVGYDLALQDILSEYLFRLVEGE